MRPNAVLGLFWLLATSCYSLAQQDCYGAMVQVEVRLEGKPQPVGSFFGYPAPFGGRLNATAGPALPLAVPSPINACGALEGAPSPGAAALVARGNCSFTDKAWALQRAGYASMLLYNNEADCVLMAANRSEVRGLHLAVVSLTRQAGEALLQLSSQHAAGGLTVVVSMPPESAVDWSAVALWVMATGTLVCGSLWAGQTHAAALGRESATPTARKGSGVEQAGVDISGQAAVGFVVAASGTLLLLFFFLSKWLAALLVVLFAVGACQACTAVLLSGLQYVSSPQWRATYVKLPAAGLVPANGLAAAALAASLCVTWAVWHNAPWSWPLQNVMGVCFMLVIMRQFFLPNLKVATLLLCLAFVYDVWWVFLQPMVTGGASVMVEVATGGATHEQLPMVLRWPHHALGTNPAFAILGLGDVVLPGVLAVFCRRFDLTHRLGLFRSYFLPCVIGYGTGLLLTYCALWFSWFGDEGSRRCYTSFPAPWVLYRCSDSAGDSGPTYGAMILRPGALASIHPLDWSLTAWKPGSCPAQTRGSCHVHLYCCPSKPVDLRTVVGEHLY